MHVVRSHALVRNMVRGRCYSSVKGNHAVCAFVHFFVFCVRVDANCAHKSDRDLLDLVYCLPYEVDSAIDCVFNWFGALIELQLVEFCADLFLLFFVALNNFSMPVVQEFKLIF